MHRRRFLAVAAATSVAGCTGDTPSPATEKTVTPTDQHASATTSKSTSKSIAAPANGGETTGDSTPSETAPDRRYGVSLSPLSYADEDFLEFFDRAAETGSIVRSGGKWMDLGDSASGSHAIASLATQFGYEPVVEVNPFSASSGEVHRPLTAANRAEYVEMAVSFVETYRSPFLGLGVEVNFLSEEDPAAFEQFVTLFADAYEAVKAVSPETTVSVGFQLERTNGLHGGLFGGENDPANAQWNLVDRFPDADVVTLTTYPGLVYRDPQEIPATYYTEAADRIDKPLAITETGWTAGTVADGWESDEAEQARFVERLFETTADIELRHLLWSFLYDQEGVPVAFRKMALRRPDGTPRPAWATWVDAITEEGDRRRKAAR
jgi:hypothetical protein